MNQKILLYFFLFGAIAWLAACAQTGEIESSASTEVPVATQASTAIPTVIPVAVINQPLLIWLPDELATPYDETVYLQWEQGIREFEDTTEGTVIDWRIKAAGGVGGNMATLQSASEVAPAAIPDLMLLRKEELALAAASGLIQPWPEIPLDLLGDLPNVVRESSELDEVIYGIPNNLILTHFVFDMETIPADTRVFSFTGIIENEINFRLSLGESTQIRELLVSQLMLAQSELQGDPDELNLVALEELFSFYEYSFSLGLILTEEDSDQQASAWKASSSEYLHATAKGEKLGYAPIPNRSGSELAWIDAWYWVLPSAKVNRHPASIDFVFWMLDSEWQRKYLTSLNHLPARRSVRADNETNEYLNFVEASLTKAEAMVEIEESLANLVLLNFISMSHGQTTTEAVLAAIAEQYQPNP